MNGDVEKGKETTKFSIDLLEKQNSVAYSDHQEMNNITNSNDSSTNNNSTFRTNTSSNNNKHRMKECNKHENHDLYNLIRSCMTCGKEYIRCDMCRLAKNSNLPDNMCMRCGPSLNRMRPILEVKEKEINELEKRVGRLERELNGYDDMKKRCQSLKQQNNDYKVELEQIKNEMDDIKQQTHRIKANSQKLNDDLKPRQALGNDLGYLLVPGITNFSDCIITCGSQSYYLHKCILIARSEPLRQILVNAERKNSSPQKSPAETPTKREQSPQLPSIFLTQNNDSHSASKYRSTSTTSTTTASAAAAAAAVPSTIAPIHIELNDVNSDIMPLIVRYLYTGEIDGSNITEQNVAHIMKAADKFQLIGLRALCLNYMEDRINTTTVVPILIEAFEQRHDKLKNRCIKFLKGIHLLLKRKKENLKKLKKIIR
jgi:hypothetical protein